MLSFPVEEFAAYLAKKRDEGIIDVVTNRRAFLSAYTDSEASY